MVRKRFERGLITPENPKHRRPFWLADSGRADYNEDMDSGLSAAVGGMENAFATNAERAQRIAASSPVASGFARDMAELPTDADAAKANASVIKTQDQMLGTLLDMSS